MSEITNSLEEEIAFGRRAVKEGFLDTDQFLDSLRIYKQLRDKNKAMSLADIFIKKGLLKEADLTGLLVSIPDDVVNMIEGYRIEKKLGEGGMGMVYKAKQISMDREVALKILSPRLTNDRQFVQRFFREARASGKLNHPNIVQGFDSGVSGGHHYITMEFIDGRTVEDVLKEKGKFDEKEALRICCEVAKALGHADQFGIVHRDIKPDNIMMSTRGEVKLTDMGLARQEMDPNITQVGMAMGTPNYISPEQAKAEENLDIRADIYSLGATLFHLVTGELPFTGKSVDVILTKHVVETPRSVKEMVPELSSDIDDLITKLMAKSPDDRFQKPEVLVETIQRIIEGKGVTLEAGLDAKLLKRLRSERNISTPVKLKQDKVEHLIGASDYLKRAKLKTIQREYKPNSIVFYEGQEPDKVYLLLSGKLEILRAGRVTYTITDKLTYFGEISMLKDCPREFTARTTSPCIIVELTPDQYKKVLMNTPNICLELIERMGRLLNEIDFSMIKKEQKLEATRTQLRMSQHRDDEAVDMIKAMSDLISKAEVDRKTKRLFYEEVSSWSDHFMVQDWVEDQISKNRIK